jgi:hypothetical protein
VYHSKIEIPLNLSKFGDFPIFFLKNINILAVNLFSTVLGIKPMASKQSLLGSEVGRGRGWGEGRSRGKGGVMTQSLHAHMNKEKKNRGLPTC